MDLSSSGSKLAPRVITKLFESYPGSSPRSLEFFKTNLKILYLSPMHHSRSRLAEYVDSLRPLRISEPQTQNIARHNALLIPHHDLIILIII